MKTTVAISSSFTEIRVLGSLPMDPNKPLQSPRMSQTGVLTEALTLELATGIVRGSETVYL